MIWIWLLVTFCLLAVVAFRFVKGGSVAHEVLRLPNLWYRNYQVDLSGVTYSRIYYGKQKHQYFLKVLPPEGVPLKKSVMVFFHGGAWRFGKPEYFLSYAAYFAGRGYPVFMPSARRLPRYDFTDMREDLFLLTYKLKECLETEGLSAKSWILGGMSSGGHLASHLLLDPELRKATLEISGAILLASPLSLDRLRINTVRKALAGDPGTASYRKANPINLLSQKYWPPMLLAHGTRDGLVPIACSEEFVEVARAGGNENLEYYIIPDGTHLIAVSWAYEENELSERIDNWLLERESHS